MKFAQTSGVSCPICESATIATSHEQEQFEYGSGKDKALLTVYIPVHQCAACGFEFVDEKAANIRHDAVCRHLGLLTPSDVKEIRVKISGSQRQFAALTGLGEATIQRWEQGQVLQSTSNDLYLRLLRYPENVERIRYKHRGDDMDTYSDRKLGQFTGNGLDDAAIQSLQAQSQVFSLQRKAN